MTYQPNAARYQNMHYNRCGKSGLKLPALSLGLWHNFGDDALHENKRAICHQAFDLGIIHFDLANNYGPPPGSAELAFGRILKEDFLNHRDELIISSKAGYDMWPGPYGEWGSKKNLIASCDQSLKRLGVDYVDIFYSHRFDPETPLEETMMALDHIVRSGRALYVGVSSYNAKQTRESYAILKELGTPCLIHQPRYSMFDRWIEEDGLLDTLEELGMGSIVFSPLAQGVLTSKYLTGIPQKSRANQQKSLDPRSLGAENLERIIALNEIAKRRDQTLAQMAIAWVLKSKMVTSALIGASRPEQVSECVKALDHVSFTDSELTEIDQYAIDGAIYSWQDSNEK